MNAWLKDGYKKCHFYFLTCLHVIQGCYLTTQDTSTKKNQTHQIHVLLLPQGAPPKVIENMCKTFAHQWGKLQVKSKLFETRVNYRFHQDSVLSHSS